LIQGWSKRILTILGLKKTVHKRPGSVVEDGRLRLSGGNIPDAVEGRLMLESIGRLEYTVNRLMDRAYEDDWTRLRAGGGV
jgi:hypothetical protein